jgi:hypothetical protein
MIIISIMEEEEKKNESNNIVKRISHYIYLIKIPKIGKTRKLNENLSHSMSYFRLIDVTIDNHY